MASLKKPIEVVWKTKPPEISKPELAYINKSVIGAIERQSKIRSPLGRVIRGFLPDGGYSQSNTKTRLLLYDLGYEPRPRLGLAAVQKIIKEAAARNDVRFFIRLGRRLEEQPKVEGGFDYFSPYMFDQFLVGNWLDSKDNYPALCMLNLDGMRKVLKARIDVTVSEEKLDKQRARLGLKSISGKKLRVELSGQTLFISGRT